jgi:hypothetical protein
MSGGGPQSSGDVGPKRRTDDVRSAVARCATPVSPLTSRPAAATSAVSPRRSVRPAHTASSARPAARATARASSRSAGDPVTTTARPCAASLRATAAKRSTGQRRAPLAAPGWITVAPRTSAGSSSGGGSSSILRGSAGMPLSLRRRHQRSTSCSYERCRGPPALSGTSGCAKAIRRRGRAASSARWLCGPRPWRLTPSAALRARATGSSGAVGSTSSTAPACSASGSSQAGQASTTRWSGNAARSPRRAGSAVSRSPRPSARRTRMVCPSRCKA